MSLHTIFRRALGASLLLMLCLTTALQASAAPATGAARSRQALAYTRSANPEAQRLRQMKLRGQLAPTVQVLDSLPPTTIEQFALVPSGIKNAFPNATALVTIVRGDRDDSVSDTITIDVQKMPPNITFTIFFIEIASKPFGHVQYVADLTTRGDGSGESVFHIIALVAFAMDARNPGSSPDKLEGEAPGIQLEHLGMWFASLQDAQHVLGDNTLTGTLFDGGNPPLHAGPQAMTDGQTAPVF